jgi:hypothetical protein
MARPDSWDDVSALGDMAERDLFRGDMGTAFAHTLAAEAMAQRLAANPDAEVDHYFPEDVLPHKRPPFPTK